MAPASQHRLLLLLCLALCTGLVAAATKATAGAGTTYRVGHRAVHLSVARPRSTAAPTVALRLDVNFSTPVYVSRTWTALQVVANPLLRRGMPVHDAMWASLRQLGADYVRYVPWFPYPALGVAELDPPDASAQRTFWSFDECGNMLDDFMAAVGNGSVIINFSTQPTWLYNTRDWSYPSNPNDVDWNYPRGNGLRDPSGRALGDYYGRLLAWMTQGGFIDEFGREHGRGRRYRFPYWEVFNEPEGCHGIDAAAYVEQYNAVVRGFQRHAPAGVSGLRYAGPALGGHNEWDWFAAVLNASRFAADVPPPDLITFHYYAGAASRTDPQAFEAFFTGVDSFAEECDRIIAMRNQLRPTARLDVDELGVILPNDNDPKAAIPPPIYWNAAAAMYAYSYIVLGAKGIDVLGESQLVGNPDMPHLQIAPQFPSVSMLNWTTGAGNARYWVLKLLLDHLAPGDVAVQTRISSDPLCGAVLNLANLTLACARPDAVIHSIDFAAYGTPSGSCGAYRRGACDASNASAIVARLCVGRNRCSIAADTATFGDPCYGTVKQLVVQARCSDGGGISNADVAAQGFRIRRSAANRVLIVNKSSVSQTVTYPAGVGSTAYIVDLATGDGPPRRESLQLAQIVLSPYAVMLVEHR